MTTVTDTMVTVAGEPDNTAIRFTIPTVRTSVSGTQTVTLKHKLVTPVNGSFSVELDRGLVYASIGSRRKEFVVPASGSARMGALIDAYLPPTAATDLIEDAVTAWFIAHPGSGGGGGTTTVDGLTDAGVAGKQVVKSGTAAQARTAIDAAPTTHGHTSVQITDLAEYIQDTVAGLLKAGSNVTTTYDDAANTFTINATGGTGGTTDPEVVRDTIGGALVAGSGIAVTVNDAGDTITIAAAGIPKTGLAAAVQTSLGKADASVQTVNGTAPDTAGNVVVSGGGGAPTANPTFTGVVTTPALRVTGGSPATGKVLTADASGNATWQAGTPGPAGTGGGGWISVKDYGAVGNGSTDDTTAIANAYQACVNAAIGDCPKALYFPSGWYRVTSLPSFVNYSTIIGDGQRATTILYEGTGTLCTLSARQEVTIRNLGFWATGIGSTTLDLSACFSVYVESVLFRGAHGSGSGSTYRTQVGVNIRDNTGNTQFNHCNWNNLGIGLRTYTIQNHVAKSKFAYCYTSILGTGNNANAGLNMFQVEFDSAKDATTTRCHLDIDGSANTWSLNEVWFEGGNQAMIVGRAGVGGPSSFSMMQSKVAGRAVYCDFQQATMITLASCEFNPDQQTPAGTAELSINATYCPAGFASMLMTTTSGRNNQIPRSLFPNSWTVIDKQGIRSNFAAP